MLIRLAVLAALMPFSSARAQDNGLCRVESFKVQLDGWTRTDWKTPEPCSVKPIAPNATCTEAPCFNLACHAILHYVAVVELSPGETHVFRPCFFKQQRMGSRGHNDGGERKLDELDATETYDFSGSPETGLKMRPVEGRPDHWAVEFYDIPGWYAAYWNGVPNAVAPKWFPIDWHYMYRAYLGPKHEGIEPGDYQYVRVDMEASVAPEPGIAHAQAYRSLADWLAFKTELQALPPLPAPPEDKGAPADLGPLVPTHPGQRTPDAGRTAF